MNRKHIGIDIPWPTIHSHKSLFSRWLPTRGNVLFTLLMIALLLWAQTAGALPLFSSPSTTNTSQSTIAYQGRLADADGNPITKQVSMTFRLYGQREGGVPLWEEPWIGSSGVNVSDGLFNVMLGSLVPIPQNVITGNDTLWLGITVGTDDEMAPRVQLGTVPFAVQALTVPDGSITTAKLAADVSLEPPDGSITTAKIADGAVTSEKLDIGGGLSIDGPFSVAGDISLSGVFNGTKSYWADYRDYLRFMEQDGVTASQLCPEGGTPVGVTGPKQSIDLSTGNDICRSNWDTSKQSCLNVHQVAPCGSIIGNHFPYGAESCTTDFSGKWAPFFWWNGEPTHNVTFNILGSGIGCFSVKYACCK